MSKNEYTLSKIVRAMMKKNRQDEPFFIAEGRTDPFDNQGITQEELVKRMGLSSWEVIKKRLNHQRPLNRDFLIALLSQLQLNTSMANYILNMAEFPLLYSGEDRNGMDSADDSVINKRDKILIAKLEESTTNLVSIDEINQSLIRQGSSPLKIKGRRNTDYSDDYYVLKTRTKVDYDEAHLFIMCANSLGVLYDVDLYPIVASALVKHNNSGDYFVLKMRNNYCSLFRCDEHGMITGDSKSFKSIADTDLLLRPIFNDLENLIAIEKKKIMSQFDDTKNYNVRISTKYFSGSYHVFAEKFDFSIPEKNEYFFLDYHDGQYNFSISNKSQFFYYYLGEDKYKSFFRFYNPKILYSSNSVDKIKSYLENASRSTVTRRLSSKRIETFNNLILEAENLINELKNESRYILDIYSFLDEPDIDYTVCAYYNILDKFDFIQMDNNDITDVYLPRVQESAFVVDDKEILVSLNDVRKAFSYGLPTINDICSVKLKYGSIENLINNL